MLELEFAQITDPGRVRGHNEDYAGYVAPETPEQAQRRGWLFALADGVGGQERGEVASQAAVEALLSGFREAAASEGLAEACQRCAERPQPSVWGGS